MAESASEFIDKHGYVKGTYEGKLISEGYNLADVKKQYTRGWGANINPGEYQKIKAAIGPSPMQQMGIQARENLQNIASQEYAFDPNKFLPGIKQQAESIYSPQQAQLEAIRQLQSSQYQDQSITTEEQFDKELQSTIESINNRGAYFGGGAIEAEGDIREQKLRALNQLGLQAQAADFSNLAQQGILAAEEAQFIQDRLYNAEAGAYARWSDQRNFSYQAAVQQYQMYTDERNFARGVFESDRSYNLSVQELEMRREEFQQTYKINEEQFEMAKQKFNIDIQKNQLSLDQAMTKFKSQYAVTNSGIFGVTDTGEDQLDVYRKDYEMMYGGSSNNNPSYTPVNQDGGVFDVDAYIATGGRV